GPVTATVSIGGRAIPVEPAWVAVAPPNYAPDVIAWRTLYDLLHDSYVQCGWLPFPDTASFTKDVLPSLRRLSNLQWVNKGFATMFGKGCPMDFENPDFIAKLAYRPANAGDADPYAELRQQVFNAFRPANNKVNDPRTWPWIYGDAYGSFSDTSPRNNLALPDVRAGLLEFWVRGKFVNDWNGSMLPDGDIETLPIAEQPSMLDQAALHFCLADAFHPGCEMTWPMRHTTMYSAPFRIRHRTSGEPPLTYGSELTQEIVLLPGGPLYAQAPGDISRWMALPWQGDTAFCRSGYSPEYDPYLPTFWPARVPNQVLTQDDYETVIDTTLPRETRVAAYNNRENWLRALSGPAPQQMMEMIAEFGKMGIVEARPGVANDPDFPEMMMVECLPLEVAQALKAKASTRLLKAAPGAVPEEKSLLERAGWESAEQLEEFRRLIRW
ncbi:MAG: LodA/GoxA family CTQ-dependent oxidase, partial [Bacteroidota bacterium]